MANGSTRACWPRAARRWTGFSPSRRTAARHCTKCSTYDAPRARAPSVIDGVAVDALTHVARTLESFLGISRGGPLRYGSTPSWVLTGTTKRIAAGTAT